MPSITRIQVPGTNRPSGHYSQATVYGGLIYVSGQLPSDLATGTPIAGSIEDQTERAMHNVQRILESAGSGLEHVIQMTLFLSSIDDWPAVNGVYARIIGDHRPSRAIVPVAPLHFGTGIEITCIAAVPKKRAARTAARKAVKPVRKAARRAASRRAR